jgi:pheromone shutdown protein TraB
LTYAQLTPSFDVSSRIAEREGIMTLTIYTALTDTIQYPGPDGSGADFPVFLGIAGFIIVAVLILLSALRALAAIATAAAAFAAAITVALVVMTAIGVFAGLLAVATGSIPGLPS